MNYRGSELQTIVDYSLSKENVRGHAQIEDCHKVDSTGQTIEQKRSFW